MAEEKLPHDASIEITVIPWLTDLLDPPCSNRTIWREMILPGDSVRAFLGRLHGSHPRLSEAVYDLEDARLTGRANLILNDRALELSGGLDTSLHRGDHLVLVPAYVGG